MLPVVYLMDARPLAPLEFSLLASSDFRCTVRETVDTPSTNLVRKMTLALLNIPSLSDTTTNCHRSRQEK